MMLSVLKKKPLEYLQIEPTRKCNLKCAHCTRTEDYGDLTVEMYLKILDNHKDAKIVKLQGLGEPMFHPSILEFIRIAKSRGHEVMVITNGTIRLPDHVDYLVVSLETMNPEKYRTLRSGDIKKVLDNIHDAYERNLPLIINCVQTHLTDRTDVYAVIDFANSIGATMWVLPQEVWVDPKHWRYQELRQNAKLAAQKHAYGAPMEKERMKSCGWRQGTAIYYDYLGRRHPCCIRMDDEYLGAPSKNIGCIECPW